MSARFEGKPGLLGMLASMGSLGHGRGGHIDRAREPVLLDPEDEFLIPAFLRPISPCSRDEPPAPAPGSAIQVVPPPLPMGPRWGGDSPRPAGVSGRQTVPMAVETPRRTLDPASTLFAEAFAAAGTSQAHATPWITCARPAEAEGRRALPGREPVPTPGRPLLRPLTLGAPGGAEIEDTAAQLLRPLLRHWLDEHAACGFAAPQRSAGSAAGKLR